jgi:GH25 family lysozyme M1 (1,4-beta-N-acetylmuramidase)
MFVKSGGTIAATATLALLTVTAPVLAASGPAPPAGDPVTPAGGIPPAAGAPPAAGTSPVADTSPAAAAASRAATAALPHSPQLLRDLAGPFRPSAAAPSAAGPTVHGIDVAAFQHPRGVRVNWAAVAKAGYKFAAVKVTEGTYYVNPWGARDLVGAKQAGLYVTPYHFAIPNRGGGAPQARYAVQRSHYATGGQMLPLMLDIEYDPYTGTDGTNECYGLSHARMTAWIAAFIATARSLTGQFPVIYTTAGWWHACTGGSKAFSADPMWVAAYGFAKPPLPAGWRVWTFWQYTSTGTVRGVDTPGNTDLNVFNTTQVGLIDPGNQRTSAAATVSLPVKSLAAVAKRPLSYKATGLPPGLAISSQGIIKGAAGAATGTYHVTVSATNTSGGNGSVQFTWQVSATSNMRHEARPRLTLARTH